MDEEEEEEEEGRLSDLDSSWSLVVAQWKPRLRLLHWGFTAVGAATTVVRNIFITVSKLHNDISHLY